MSDWAIVAVTFLICFTVLTVVAMGSRAYQSSFEDDKEESQDE